MCKFCEGSDRKNSGKFAIYMTKWSDERGTTLSVDFDGFDESSDTDFEVNFCPMCGKQLKQVQESTELTEVFEVLRENGYIAEATDCGSIIIRTDKDGNVDYYESTSLYGEISFTDDVYKAYIYLHPSAIAEKIKLLSQKYPEYTFTKGKGQLK